MSAASITLLPGGHYSNKRPSSSLAAKLQVCPLIVLVFLVLALAVRVRIGRTSFAALVGAWLNYPAKILPFWLLSL